MTLRVQRKAPAKRAFARLTGSVLVRGEEIVEPPTTSPETPEVMTEIAVVDMNNVPPTNPGTMKVGRPCIGDQPMTAAERKRRQREKLAAELEKQSFREEFQQMFIAAARRLFPNHDIFSDKDVGTYQYLPTAWVKLDTNDLFKVLEAIRTPENDQFINEILATERQEAQAELEQINQPHASNDFIRNAPSGKGQLVTGGYSSEKVEQVLAAHELTQRNLELNGPKGGPTGYGAGDEGDHREIASQFMARLRFTKKSLKLSEREVEDLIEKLVVVSFSNDGTKEWSELPHKWGNNFRCELPMRGKPCGFLAVDWHQAITHLGTDHKKVVAKAVKDHTPKHISKPKPKCTDREHADTLKRIRAMGETDDIYCGKCKHLLSFVTAA